MEYNNKEVGQRIKELRLNKGDTLESFGNRFNTSKVTVYNWEIGRNLPNKSNLKEIAELGGISVNELLYGDPKQYLEKVIWNHQPHIEFSSDIFNEFYDSLDKEYSNLSEDLYLSEDEAVERYQRFSELVKRDKNINPLGSAIYSALQNVENISKEDNITKEDNIRNKGDVTMLKYWLDEASNHYQSLFGKSVENAFEDSNK